MKEPRLTKSKTRYESAVSASGENRDTPASAGHPFKTSLDDLRNPDDRQKLREQLWSAFPEPYAGSLKSSPSAASVTSMAGTDWTNAASSSMDSNGNGPKRLSTLPERNQAVDVEQAIHLLTELKKTATPDQLVALHKALLPTRDSIISTADASAGHGQRESVIRQKSMLPPGLATRGGASDDLLKRQEDVEPAVKKSSGRSVNHLRVQSNTSIAALDLADDAANSMPALRAVTPNDEHYFGAFRPGTLRITNGAASPVPSLRPNPSGDGAGIAISSEHLAVGRARAESFAKAESEAQAKRDPIDDSRKKRAETFHGREARPLLPRSKPRDPSRSRCREPSQSRSRGPSPTRSRDPSLSGQNRSRPSLEPLARSREPSLSRVPMQAGTRQSEQLNIASKKASVDTLLRRSIDSFTIRKSLDDGRVSPLDAPPRFFQRWSHRASQISQEYMMDCEVPGSPFEDRQNAMAFAQRLSTVFDGEDAEDTATETPEAALSKLEGNAHAAEEPFEERRSPRATAAGINYAARPPLFSHYSAPRPMLSKADSGYVSDASPHSTQREHSYDAAAKYSRSPVMYEEPQSESTATTPRAEPDNEEMQEHGLKVPSLLSGPTTPSRPDAVRKHSSFIKLPGLKKSSLAVSKTPLDAHDSVDSSAPSDDVACNSPADPKTIKPSKKLQKRMPEELRQQRRALRELAKQKQLSLTLAGQGGNFTEASTDLMSSPLPISEPATPSTSMAPASPLVVRDENIPAELVGDCRQPAELDTDESATAPKRSSSGRQSRKSRRRSRQNTVTATTAATDTEDAADQKSRKRSFSLGRKRSKSKRRSGSLTPKRKSQEVPAVPSIAALSAMWSENGSQESLPLYSDHGSVARTLGTNPYDISTSMIKSGNSSRTVLDELQSPHQISTAFSRSRTGGLRGMDSEMASELARRKSRDVAIQNNEELYDHPRMATPKKQDVMRARSSMPNAIMVEQRSPGWYAKPVFRKPSFETLDHVSRERPHSIAESIPSLPELPADAEARSVKAGEYLAKRTRGMQASFVLAESPSPAASPNPSNTEHPGFSDESVDDAVAKAVAARPAKRGERVRQQGQNPDRLRPRGPRMNSDASGSSGKVSLQLHTPDERPYSDASASIVIGIGSERDDQEGRPGTAPAQHDENETSVWERQAQLWRQQRESVGKSSNKPADSDAGVKVLQPTGSSSILASSHGTPSARDSLPSARRRRESASEHANVYLELIGSEDHTPPHSNRASTQSTPTVNGISPTGTVVVEDALPAKAYQATSIYRSRSPGGRVRTPSGSYHPYTPDNAAQAERSRTGCLAQLEGKDMRDTRSLDILRRTHHQPTNALEAIVVRYDRTLSPVPASETGSIESPDRRVKGPERGPPIDRYGGGLQYGYERGVGLQGSSGMRSSMVAKPPRSGNQFSEHFGLDLGDVPMFLSRAG